MHVRSWQTGYEGLLPAEFLAGLRPEDWAPRYTFDVPDPLTTLAVDATGEILGILTTSVADGAGRLMALYVDPPAWRRGVGRVLESVASDRFRTAGLAEADLWVLRGNARAERFYRSCGWESDGTTRREMVRGADVEEVRFVKHFAD